MKQKLSQTNRKAAAAFLLCTSLVAGHPFTSFALDESHAVLMAQQQQTIQGTVKTVTGEPIIGANVREQGKPTNGTITDLEGNFKLKVSLGATLEVSYIGYKTITLKATPEKPMEITLEEDSKNLDEVVVVGFGTQKKVNLTGSVGTATAKDLAYIIHTIGYNANSIRPILHISSLTI